MIHFTYDQKKTDRVRSDFSSIQFTCRFVNQILSLNVSNRKDQALIRKKKKKRFLLKEEKFLFYISLSLSLAHHLTNQCFLFPLHLFFPVLSFSRKSKDTKQCIFNLCLFFSLKPLSIDIVGIFAFYFSLLFSL